MNEMKKLTEKIYNTYVSKNADYGDSFGISVKKYGLISALTRMSDKFNRIEQLIIDGKQNHESLTDSLEDLACYALMTVMEIQNSSLKVDKKRVEQTEQIDTWEEQQLKNKMYRDTIGKEDYD